ncbi:hypothetical protein LC593_28470 [Nostoc sp. CHAB 5844]|nr:hypothetical protein [Nostoc sp. CHAB 5844]
MNHSEWRVKVLEEVQQIPDAKNLLPKMLSYLLQNSLLLYRQKSMQTCDSKGFLLMILTY